MRAKFAPSMRNMTDAITESEAAEDEAQNCPVCDCELVEDDDGILFCPACGYEE